MLQALVLRHRVAPVHGGHPLAGVCQQVRVLLAPPHQPRGEGVEVGDGPRRHDRRHRRERARQDGQANEGRAWGPARQAGRGHGPPALRAEPGGGTHHVPADQRARGGAARPPHIHLPRHQRAVPGPHGADGARDAAVRVGGRGDPREPQGHRPPHLQGLLGALPRVPAPAARKAAAHGVPPHARGGLEHGGGGGVRQAAGARAPGLH
mmetsp:Transcript_54714/g.173761  ORF Transcript_54714/g.173761 Transcript_54714/m.173761 type:complete len:208 (+) Transcript_54714:204-827(+)